MLDAININMGAWLHKEPTVCTLFDEERPISKVERQLNLHSVPFE